MIHYVSIGSICSVAYQLQEHQLRKVAYPFDWLKINSFQDLNLCLEDDFKQFLEVKFIRESVKHPLLKNEEDKFIIPEKKDNECKDKEFEESEKNNLNPAEISLVMKNAYNFEFFHDFPRDYNLSEIQEKYQRRIDRLKKILENKEEEIIFIRDELKLAQVKEADIKKFIEILEKINPELKYRLVLILHNPKHKKIEEIFKEIIGEKFKKKIYFINDTDKFAGWTRDNLEWGEIFKVG